MPSIPFHYVDLRAFCYVTEDDKRVEAALREFLPAEFEIDRATSEGHYGDRILVLSARVETADAVRTVLERLADLPESDRETIEREIEDRVDENTSFFLTVDKQAAYNGQVKLGDGITLRAKVEAYPAKKPNAVDAVEETFDEVV